MNPEHNTARASTGATPAGTRAAQPSEEGASFAVATPSISLPKGGGAIRGMGEKFAANPVTGTGSMSVPIATSPGRGGFGPQLALSYDSGAGNGAFGFGWSLSLPQITRKTDKGLPRYDDAAESDVFLLSGAEDLVPVLKEIAPGQWEPETVLPRTIDGHTYTIKRYRPRIEGLFARIERWTREDGDVHWRSLTRDNILTVYGKDANARIVDSEDATRIFSWLICETRDDKGNAVLYKYKTEDGTGLDLAQAHEANRGSRTDRRRQTNRYIKHIFYGNCKSLLDPNGRRPRFLSSQQIADAGWMFEAVFDYGDHDANAPGPNDDTLEDPPGTLKFPWQARTDPFSSYRAGFEVRTYRLCQRVLMFHHFPGTEQEGVGTDCLVRSTDFEYAAEIDPADARNPVYTFLESVTQTGYQRDGADGYRSKSLPPVEFVYSEPVVQDTVEEVDPASLENLPVGLDGGGYRWTDLHGEGIPGILTEQAGAWFYKRNLSPINQRPGHEPDGPNGPAHIARRPHIEAAFAPLEIVALKPNVALSSGADFMDLAGDGQPDLVVMDGPMPGLYEHDAAEGWEPFRPFTARLNRDLGAPNLKFIDLDGDGHADVLITEDDAFVWHASLAEEGFSPARRVAQSLDEEKGPHIIFADGTQSIYLADLSGDGLTDIVRVRNGEVCYWPNLGYGRFGTKVTMDHAPRFDHPDQFDQKRIRLADIDGSGTTDIIYLHRNGVRLYFNQSGNSWSAPQTLNVFPRIDDLVSIVPTDLLGNGTACLVWSSALPGDARRPMRYVNLMGGQKPHLLVKTINNLGAETTVEYAPSTRFYLQDKQAGKSWITRLPFPVHVVEKVTVTDSWRKTSFTSTYSYHHGYFDGEEREFRGFGRVEQVDVESYGKFDQGNAASPYITDDKTLYQPPVKTITWYHTGAFFDRERFLAHFEHEYFPHWLEKQYPGKVKILGGFQENDLPEPDLEAENLSAEEWREALRACKGMMLRQEVVELDVDALERPEDPEQLPVKLFSTAYHNCTIRRLQPKDGNRHAVFLVAESEAITYHYELDIREEQLPKLNPDPRIAHTLNLQFDEYANVLQSVAVVYPRLGKFEDDTDLADGLTDALSLIRKVQKEEPHLAYTETRYTNDVPDADHPDPDNYRLCVPCEVLTYELTGLRLQNDNQRHFTVDELRGFRLSDVHQTDGSAVGEIAYHELPDRPSPDRLSPQKRCVEHVRLLFFRDNLSGPLPFRRLGRLGLPYETYKLALTDELLNAIFTDDEGNKLDEPIRGATTSRQLLRDAEISGYLSGTKLAERFEPVPANELTGQYWIRSGIAGFAPDAAQQFFLPEEYTDPFGNVTTLEYDECDLYIKSSTDALGNRTEVTDFDFRLLAPRQMKDANNNLSEVRFDILGMPTAMALMGKGDESDNLSAFDDALLNPDLAARQGFFVDKAYDVVDAQSLLRDASARHVYYFGEVIKDGKTVWAQHPPCACGIVREQHAAQQPNSPVQTKFEYSDGGGNVLVAKAQAEPAQPGGPLRWVASGKTILNNKGKPVKQYEPYFSKPAISHRFDAEEAGHAEGVTVVVYYDAAGRTVRTEMPDGSYSRVEFSPWHVRTFDQNDTVKEPGNAWFANNTAATATTEEKRAAQLAAEHAGTPALTILDSLGRDVIAIAHNRVKDAAGVMKDEKYLTFTKLDAEGKPLWIRDARNNRVMQYIALPAPNNQTADPVAGFAPCYDIAGNLLFQHSMDAGDRWMLNDAAGKPMVAWNSRGFITRAEYDELHRPTALIVKDKDGNTFTAERTVYGEMAFGNAKTDPAASARARQTNHLGKPYQVYDGAGIVTSVLYDFKGNLIRSERRLLHGYKAQVNWPALQSPPQPLPLLLEDETFVSRISYDALNRPIQIIAPHSAAGPVRINVVQPGYNEAGLLERLDVWLNRNAEPGELLASGTADQRAVKNIDYNAKGQRELIAYGNGATTTYAYDENTFRLTHLRTTRPPGLNGLAPIFVDPRVLQDLHYTYDPAGNITRIADAALKTFIQGGQPVAAACDFTYDALYRLTAASGREHSGQTGFDFNPPSGDFRDYPFAGQRVHANDLQGLRGYVEQYHYDAVGNIMHMAHHTGTSVDQPGQVLWNRYYQYALDSNRLLAISIPSDQNVLPEYVAAASYSHSYSYDAHGNMTGMPHLPLMQWDFKDQLQASTQQVRQDGGKPETTYYVYDAGGQRSRKVTERQAAPGQTPTRAKERIYLGGYEIYREYNGNGLTVTLERETLHVMDDKQRIALVETKTMPAIGQPLIRYQLGNHLGSASVELDKAGSLISYEEYHPYGTTAFQAMNAAGVSSKRYRYTGKERDEENGFTYHGARYYAPWFGRWTACDPVVPEGRLSAYAYAADNPVHFIDPDGKQACYPKGYTGPPIPELDAEIRAQREASEKRNPEARFAREHPTATAIIEGIQFVGSVIFLVRDVRSLASGIRLPSRQQLKDFDADKRGAIKIPGTGTKTSPSAMPSSPPNAAALVQTPSATPSPAVAAPSQTAPTAAPTAAAPAPAPKAATRVGNREFARAPEQHNDLVTRDTSGRLLSVTGVLRREQLGTGTRTTAAAQASAKTEGTYDAGHARAANLGGLGEVSLTFPQLPGLNRGQFRMFEKRLGGLVRDQGPTDRIIFNVQLQYSGTTNVPSRIGYNVRINGATVRGRFLNDRNEMHFMVNPPRTP